jgi:glycosyltransferase involved in cell wall biosynthesis
VTRSPSIVFASREVWPFLEGGGIGRSVWAASRLLAEHAEVTVLTSDRWRPEYNAMRQAGDPRLPTGVSFVFAAEPRGDLAPYVSGLQAWSERLLEGVAELYPDGGPDLIEVADYQGEGFAMAHARRGRDPRIRRSLLAVRLHTSAEICAELDDLRDSLHLRVLRGIERFALANADVLLEPGGDVMARYQGHYGADRLAPSLLCPPPVSADIMPEARPDPPPTNGPLRILYLNRLERRKGIAPLLAAVRSLDSDELQLTVVGGDTDTAPGGGSMRKYAQELVHGDTRITFSDRVAYGEVGALIAGHHVVVVPSAWETFSYVVREALSCNRPVLATPVGAIPDAVEPGQSGWLAGSGTTDDLRIGLEELLGRRDEVDRIIRDGLPRRAFDGKTNEREVADVYHDLVTRQAEESNRSPPEIAAIVAAEPHGPSVATTLRSLARLKPALHETTVAATAAGLATDPVELSLAQRVVATRDGSTGRVAAWLAGVEQSPGELLLLAPAGTELAPDFASRASAALAAESRFAYATAFVADGREPWHAPAGNFELPGEIDFGASVALFRRSALRDLLSAKHHPIDEAELFAELARRGHFGVVLHEPLVYRLPRRSGAGRVNRPG